MTNGGIMSDEHGAQRVNATPSDAGMVASQPRHGLADFLVDRDVGCPTCGFNLRGLAGNRCPECSTRIQLVIARPDDLWRLRYWLVAACIGHCAVTGMSVATYVVALARGASLGMLFSSWRTIATFTILLAVSLGLLAGLVRYAARRRSQRAPAHLLAVLLGALALASAWGVIANIAWWVL